MAETVEAGRVAARDGTGWIASRRLAALVAELLREQGFPVDVPPGGRTDPVRIDQDRLAAMLVEAMAGGGPERVVWVSAGSELLVDLPATRVEILDGALVAGLRVTCGQTGETDLSLVLGVGTEDRGVPVIRLSGVDGPAVLRARWADTAAAAVAAALLRVVALVAAGTGPAERRGREHRPASLWASAGTLLLAARPRYDWEAAG